MSKSIISLQNIYKNYDNGPQKIEVLKGINLEIGEAEVVVVMGPSGVGKSTLLHIIGALDLPTSGEVNITGQNIFKLKNEALARFRNASIGFVFQFHHLLPEFTALENLQIPAMMHNFLTKEKKEYIQYILEEVGLSHRLNHKPGELSGGEQQRVAVARALVNNPKVILADEPTGNLDKQNSEALYALLLELNEKLKQTLVIVTHNERMASQASRIIKLDDGRIAENYVRT
jgi:lipoprotein-releasing system ATP-binding protein